jgi:hypothetical protein
MNWMNEVVERLYVSTKFENTENILDWFEVHIVKKFNLLPDVKCYPDLINFDEIRQEYLDKNNSSEVLKPHFKEKSFDIHFSFNGLNDLSTIHFVSIALRNNDFNYIFFDLVSKQDIGIKQKVEKIIGKILTMYIPS